jgi:hypothetical protein
LAILSVIGFLNQVVLIIPVALYLLILSLAAGTAKSLGLVDRIMVLVALPVMHFSWATGFWIGLIFGAGKTVDAGDKK